MIHHCNEMQCNGIITVLLPINSAMIESLNANKSFKNIYKVLRNSVYDVLYINMHRPCTTLPYILAVILSYIFIS